MFYYLIGVEPNIGIVVELKWFLDFVLAVEVAKSTPVSLLLLPSTTSLSNVSSEANILHIFRTKI